MDRRDFVSRVTLGAATVCTAISRTSVVQASGQFNLRFIGMMGFVERRDGSFLVATPGESHHHVAHIPFLMARAGTRVASALGMTPVTGVIPAAFDTELVGTNPAGFVYRSLANTAIDVVSGTEDAVVNEATQMAHMHDIAPGKRVRGNLEKWALSTVSLRGGRLVNSAAHPDAGKVWSFGAHHQQVTDAVNYRNAGGASATLRLTSVSDVRQVTIEAGESSELWVISSAELKDRMNDPTELVHSQLMFDYLVDATPVVPHCYGATGREVPASRIPFSRGNSAGIGVVGREAVIPPLTDLCILCDILLRPLR